MEKENKVIDWHVRLTFAQRMKIILLAKLLKVSRSEAVRRAVDKMLEDEQKK